ncbi:hypothetical protein V9T40_009321 [Parthenolecanium corni]|uniref:Protein kinase domain-containing protein n=1 Tax=Parthenolecanium corni TaxID=536013 RepID=A0AAN9Y8Y3_9HEMI
MTKRRMNLNGDKVRKWAAQILIALEGLHANGVICRDLNPNNVLLADNGLIKLTYFYRYPNIDPPLNIQAKEKLYVAPKVDGTNCNVSFAFNWWSLGAILYELTMLQTLHSNHLAGINSHTVLYVPERICVEIRPLLVELLRYNPNERLGFGISRANDVKAQT